MIREHGPEPQTSVADPGRPGNGSIRDRIGLWPETVADRGPRASRDDRSYVPGLVCSGSLSSHVQSYATQPTGAYCTFHIRSSSRHPSSKLRLKSMLCNRGRVQDNTHMEATESGERTRMNQSQRCSALPISSCHCWAPPDVGVAVPKRNPMMAQNAEQPLGERLICVRMRDEDLGRHLCAAPTENQAWLRSASAIGLTSGSPLSGFGRSTQCSVQTIQGISLFGSCSRPPTATGISRFL